MGTPCGKQSNNRPCLPSPFDDPTKVKLVTPDPKESHIRDGEWVGLKNLHNTCYINSVIQSFAANNMFMGYIEKMLRLKPDTFTAKLRDCLM